MITFIGLRVNQKVFQNLKHQMPEFDHRLDINSPTGNFFYDRWEIKPEFKNTVWKDVLDSLPFAIGEARLMKLEPGSAYYSHADIDDRYHLNITGEKSFLVDLDNNKLHTVNNDGCWYEMDAGRHHSAVNFGNQTRIQLVVRKLLQKNNLENPVAIIISTDNNKHDYRYVFDDIYSPWLNRLIKNGKVDDFSFKDNRVSFNLEQNLVEEIKTICPEGFKVTVCQ